VSRGLARQLRDAAHADRSLEDASFGASFGAALAAGTERHTVRRRRRRPRDIAFAAKMPGNQVFGTRSTRSEFDA
jgi:hypothetical protein